MGRSCRPGCRSNDACATNQYCATDQCVPAISVGAILAGRANGQDGWSTSLKKGLDEAAVSLPFMRLGSHPYALEDGVDTTEELTAGIERLVTSGANVIVAGDYSATDTVVAQAKKHPSVRFLVAGAQKNPGVNNVGAYTPRAEQLWYAAGILAARNADTGRKCVGMVLPTPTVQIVRETNAFARGIRAHDSSIKLVIRWIGNAKDPSAEPSYAYKAVNYAFDSSATGNLYREEVLTAQLADLGCTLIAHRTVTQRIVTFIEQRIKRIVDGSKNPANHDLLSLGTDFRDACRANASSAGEWYESCLGVPHLRWSPLFVRVFDEMKRGTWEGRLVREPFHVGADSMMNFELSPHFGTTSILPDDVSQALSAIADAGYAAVFSGPIEFNGQRDVDGDGSVEPADQFLASGASVPEQELDRMCWFVDGVFELPDASSISYASLAPAMVPYGLSLPNQVTTLDAADAGSMRKYGDMIDYLQRTSQDPKQAMRCR